jgi:hypothetical protein
MNIAWDNRRLSLQAQLGQFRGVEGLQNLRN